MINKKYMYGQLNSEAARVNYGGKDTDSLKLTVDNTNMVISGDVQWQNMLGHTSDKAYPGDCGARNYEKILELAKQLNDEISRSTSMDAWLKAELLAGLQVTEDIEKTIEVAVAEETSRAQNSELKILNAVISGDTKLEQGINTLSTVVEAEKQQRTEITDSLLQNLTALQSVVQNAIKQLTTSVEEETRRSTIVETELQKKILDETNRATYKENVLSSSVEQLQTSIKELDDKVETKLSDSTASLVDDITEITTVLQGEIERSTAVDEQQELQLISHSNELRALNQEEIRTKSRVSVLEDQLPTVEHHLSTIEKEVQENYNEVVATTDKIQQDVELLDKELESSYSTLDEKITDEITKRIGQDQLLGNAINAITATIPNKVAALEEAVSKFPSTIEETASELDQKITEEGEVRLQVDKNLKKYIDEEVTKLQSSDAILNHRLKHITNMDFEDVSDVDLAEFATKEQLLQYSTTVEMNTAIQNAVPKKLSALDNDTNFITIEEVEDKQYLTEEDILDRTNKLAGIAEGAEVNVQSDWNELNTDSDAFIKNKPSLGTLAGKSSVSLSDLESDIQESLSKADTALQEHQNIDGKLDTEVYQSEKESFALKTDLEPLALKSDLIDFVDAEYVQTTVEKAVEDIELPADKYYTKEEVDNLIPDSEEFALKKDLENFATGDAIKESINEELNDYYTKKETDDVISQAVANIPKGDFVEHVDTEGDLRVYAAQGSEDTNVVASDTVTSSAIVIRTQTGQVELPVVETLKDTESVGSDQAVSKKFVELLLGALEEDYNNKIDEIYEIKFIDGGTCADLNN